MNSKTTKIIGCALGGGAIGAALGVVYGLVSQNGVTPPETVHTDGNKDKNDRNTWVGPDTPRKPPTDPVEKLRWLGHVNRNGGW